jgi:phosphoribosylformimino-5-aminoimidazole carboxamide ribotide isomerase
VPQWCESEFVFSTRAGRKFRALSAKNAPVSFTIVPSIDLRDGKVVRLQQGDFSRQLNYDLNPIDVAKSFADAGATIMHVVDLDGAKAGKVIQAQLISQIARGANISVQAGGGVRSTADVRTLLDAGLSRVVVGTAALLDWNWFESLHRELPHQLVLAIDAKNGQIATHGWTETSSVTALDIARRVKGWPLAALLYTDVAKDGMLQGPNVEMTAQLAAATDVPVIASGGVGSLDHIRSLLSKNIWGVILGRSLHDGKIDLADAIRVATENGSSS